MSFKKKPIQGVVFLPIIHAYHALTAPYIYTAELVTGALCVVCLPSILPESKAAGRTPQ